MATQEVMDRVWRVLTRRAGEQRTITYGELANEAKPGVSAQSVGPQYLEHIWPYCQELSMPNITSIVVLAGSDRPSYSHTGDHSLVPSTQRQVFACDWSNIDLPTVS